MRENNNYYNVTSYKNNFTKYQCGELEGKYIDLDFAYLKDLSIIDYRTRLVLFKMIIDIEHYLKVRILNTIEEIPEEDGYKIVNLYLEQDFNDKDRPKRVHESIRKKVTNEYYQKIFSKYDLDKDEYVTTEDLIRFYYDSVEVDKKLSVVWDNLKALGYRNDLKLLSEPIDNYNNDGDYSIMPRYVISNVQQFFEPLFNLQSSSDLKLANQANELINMICTNTNILNMVLEMGDKWEKAMNEESNKFKIFYLLQIVESLLENRKEEKVLKWSEEYLKKGFEVFLEKKFFTYQVDIKNEDNTKVFWCMCQIVLTSLQILSKMENFEEMFNPKVDNNKEGKKEGKKEEKKEEEKKEDEKKEEKKEEEKKEEKKEEAKEK